MVAVWGVEQASVTRICGLNVPLAVGVPEIRPALEMVTPAGNAPANRLHMVAPVPPALVIWKEYGEFCVPAGSGFALVIESAVQETVREKAAFVVTPSESVTLMVGVLEPIVVGVPLMIPPALIERPAGKVPESSVHV